MPHWRFAPLSGFFVRAVVRLCGCLFVCARRPPTRESGRTRLHHSLRRSQASTASLRREAKARKPTLEPFGAPQAYPSVPFSRCTLDALASTHETAGAAHAVHLGAKHRPQCGSTRRAVLSPVVKVTAVSVSFGGANETEQCLFVPHANRTCAAEPHRIL